MFADGQPGFGESWGGVLKNFGFVDRESHILTHMTRGHSRLITESQKSTVFETAPFSHKNDTFGLH
jgi:hypothetical protein